MQPGTGTSALRASLSLGDGGGRAGGLPDSPAQGSSGPSVWPTSVTLETFKGTLNIHSHPAWPPCWGGGVCASAWVSDAVGVSADTAVFSARALCLYLGQTYFNSAGTRAELRRPSGADTETSGWFGSAGPPRAHRVRGVGSAGWGGIPGWSLRGRGLCSSVCRCDRPPTMPPPE